MTCFFFLSSDGSRSTTLLFQWDES